VLSGSLSAVLVPVEGLADEAGHAGRQPDVGLVAGLADVTVQLPARSRPPSSTRGRARS